MLGRVCLSALVDWRYIQRNTWKGNRPDSTSISSYDFSVAIVFESDLIRIREGFHKQSEPSCFKTYLFIHVMNLNAISFRKWPKPKGWAVSQPPFYRVKTCRSQFPPSKREGGGFLAWRVIQIKWWSKHFRPLYWSDSKVGQSWWSSPLCGLKQPLINLVNGIMYAHSMVLGEPLAMY